MKTMPLRRRAWVPTARVWLLRLALVACAVTLSAAQRSRSSERKRAVAAEEEPPAENKGLLSGEVTQTGVKAVIAPHTVHVFDPYTADESRNSDEGTPEGGRAFPIDDCWGPNWACTVTFSVFWPESTGAVSSAAAEKLITAISMAPKGPLDFGLETPSHGLGHYAAGGGLYNKLAGPTTGRTPVGYWQLGSTDPVQRELSADSPNNDCLAAGEQIAFSEVDCATEPAANRPAQQYCVGPNSRCSPNTLPTPLTDHHHGVGNGCWC